MSRLRGNDVARLPRRDTSDGDGIFRRRSGDRRVDTAVAVLSVTQEPTSGARHARTNTGRLATCGMRHSRWSSSRQRQTSLVRRDCRNRLPSWRPCAQLRGRRPTSLDHAHADADPEARQSHPVHGAVRAAAAVDRRRACVLLAIGLYMAFTAPLDYQQGHAAKIMFVHVPAAWLSMFGYALVAISSFGLLVFRHPLADVSAKAAAPIGATFTALCLLTGIAVGQADVGRVLGVGPAADLGADPVLALPRPDRAALLDRGRGAGGQAHGRAEPGRHRHPAGDQVLGGVEQPAPAGQRHAAGRAHHPSLAAVAAAGDGASP